MRKKALIGVVMIAALALIGPVGSASAATHTVSVTYKIKPGPQKTTTGTFKGKPFGSGKVSQTQGAAQGAYILVLSTKGGSVTLSLLGGPQGAKIVGTWKAIHGTGKYKGIKGKGKLSGSGVVFNLTGSVKY